MRDSSSSICLGGTGCNCLGGKIGEVCVLTVVGIIVILLLLGCCFLVFFLALRPKSPQSKGMPMVYPVSAAPNNTGPVVASNSGSVLPS
ncbi:hypothetical protein P9112_007969 [Eukaryota sp. TZLM1-RC]